MKNIIKSLVIVVAVAAVAGVATYSYFSSQAVSNNNTFGTGTIDLKVADADETTFAKSVTASYGGANLAPGQWISEQLMQVKNDGNLNAHHLDLTVTLTGDTALAQYIVYPDSVNFAGADGNANALRFGTDKTGPNSVRMAVANYTAGDASYGVDNADGTYIYGPLANPDKPAGAGGGMDKDMDGKVTLKDLAAGKIRITSGTANGGIAAGTTATLWANARVDTATPDAMQGKTVTATFTWELHQDASQF